MTTSPAEPNDGAIPTKPPAKPTTYVILQLMQTEGEGREIWEKVGTAEASSGPNAVKKLANDDPKMVGEYFQCIPVSSWREGADLVHPILKLTF